MRNHKKMAILSTLTAIVLFAAGTVASLSLSSQAMFIMDGDLSQADTANNGSLSVLDDNAASSLTPANDTSAANTGSGSSTSTAGRLVELEESTAANQGSLTELDSDSPGTGSGGALQPLQPATSTQLLQQSPSFAFAAPSSANATGVGSRQWMSVTEDGVFKKIVHYRVSTYAELVACVSDGNAQDDAKKIFIQFVNDICSANLSIAGNLSSNVLYKKDLIVDGGRYTFYQTSGSDHYHTFEAAANNLTMRFQNINLNIKNRYGANYVPANKGQHKTIFHDVNFVGPQAAYVAKSDADSSTTKAGVISVGGTSSFTIRQNNGGSYGTNFVEAGHLVFESGSNVSIKFEGGITDTGKYVFQANNTTASFLVETGATVTIDALDKAGLMTMPAASESTCTIESGANFTFTGKAIFGGNGTYDLDAMTIGNNASAIFHTANIVLNIKGDKELRVGEGATFVLDGTAGKVTLGVSARFNIEKDAVVLLSGLEPGANGHPLSISANASFSAQNPRYLGIRGGATYTSPNSTTFQVQCGVMNMSLRISDQERQIVASANKGELLTIDMNSPAGHRPNSNSIWSEYGQDVIGATLNPVTPFDASAAGQMPDGSVISYMTYTSCVDSRIKTLNDTALQAALQTGNGTYTITPDATGVSPGYGPFKAETDVTVRFQAPIPDLVFNLHNRYLYTDVTQTVSSASDAFSLVAVPKLDYGKVSYAGYIKQYPLATDTKLTVLDATSNGFTVTATASNFQTAGGTKQLQRSSIGYVDQNGAYHSMMQKDGSGNAQPIKIPDTAFVSDPALGGAYHSLSLEAGKTGGNQILAELSPYEKIDMDTLYTTTIHWTLQPGRVG